MTTTRHDYPMRPAAAWPTAVLAGVGGAAMTVGSVALAVAAENAVPDGRGVPAQLVAVVALVSAVVVARALPRRARAAFIVGLAVPVLLAAAAFALVLYDLAHDPNAFTF